jgi:hypothetical protein
MTKITEADRIPEDFLIGQTYTIGGYNHYSTWVLKKMVWPFAYLETTKSGKKMETHQANLRLTPADALVVAKLRTVQVDAPIQEYAARSGSSLRILQRHAIDIKELKAEDFKITVGGKQVGVTKAEYDPSRGGYIVNWKD